CDDTELLPQAKFIADVRMTQSGSIHRMDTQRIGYLAQHMGAGRKTKTDVIDPSVGFVLHHRIGDRVNAGDVIATVHARSEADSALAQEEILRSVTVLEEPAKPLKLVHAIVTADEIVTL
ncbi:MAG: pyrimidine-nucleoside phosphorylase, partial [Firmicutes bacterium]|nr:pyrimidine-nucleoside phosphorylase [Bacillota bacterium]